MVDFIYQFLYRLNLVFYFEVLAGYFGAFLVHVHTVDVGFLLYMVLDKIKSTVLMVLVQYSGMGQSQFLSWLF